MALTDEGNGMFMPVAPAYGNTGFGGDNGWWIILLLLACNGGWGGFGGMNGFNGGLGYDFPWLLNGQNGINGNVASGFRDAQLNDSVTSVRDGIGNLATQMCDGFGNTQMALANGFAGTNAAITGAQNSMTQQMYTNQIADLERSFASQTANTAALSALQAQLAQCCCDNRAATADLKYTVATENCADRAAVAEGIRDVIAAQTASTQRILDQLCNDKIDQKNDTIAQLRSELLYARGQASQDVQTAKILAGQAAEIDGVYNRLNSCPVPTVPVYGRQPIYSCGGNMAGCGCA